MLHPDNTVFFMDICKALDGAMKSMSDEEKRRAMERLMEIGDAMKNSHAHHNVTMRRLKAFVIKGTQLEKR